MSRKREVNPIDVIEAAYDLELDDKRWLVNLADAVRPLLDTGAGYWAYRYDASTSLEDWYADALFYDFPRKLLPKVMSLQTKNPDLLTLAHFQIEGLNALREAAMKGGLGDVTQRASVSDILELFGAKDMAALQTVEPAGQGLVFAAGQKSFRHWDRRVLRLWARVNAHIAAGRRLRDAIAHGAGREEVILDARGKTHHAEGEGTTKTAREVLREAVRRVEISRGKQRTRDPEAATEAWTAMVSGRWSLVDRYERGGRRYIVARRNELRLPDPRALTARERAIAHLAALGKPNKLIGYELGLSPSTVGSHLSQVMRKLGAKTRVDLIALVTGLARGR